MFSVVPRMFFEDSAVDPMVRLVDEMSRWPAVMSRYIGEPFSQLGEPEVHNTDKDYRIRMDLKWFTPEEVKLEFDNQRVTVRAKHEEKQDNHGFISREIVRSYKLPENIDPKSMTSTMNNQGVLNIKVDKKAIEAPKETAIPVEYKG